MCLANACTTDEKHLARHPRLIDVVEGYNNCPDACINKSIYNNLPIHANNLGKERDYLYKNVILPNMPPTTINWVIQCNWTQRSLDEIPSSLNKLTTVIKFLALPITLVERKSYDSLHSRVQNEIAETQLEQ